MIYVLTAIHVIVCLVLTIIVLLQSGQAADLAGAFGGMGSQTLFGPRGSTTVLSKVTTWAAVTFMVTSLALTIVGNQHGAAAPSSVLDNRLKATPTAPAKKSAPPATPQSEKPSGAGNPAPAQQAPKK
jgi:preprotein translocase subunit SecG